MPANSYVIFTDGGSNENREETGWGAVVLRKTCNHPEVEAELYGRVEMDSSPEYYIGAVSPTCRPRTKQTYRIDLNLLVVNEM